MKESGAYTDKARLELVCLASDVERLVDIVCNNSRTGHCGDGVVFVSDVERAVKVRTGEESVLATL